MPTIKDLLEEIRPRIEDVNELSKNDWKNIVAEHWGTDPRTADKKLTAFKNAGVFKEAAGGKILVVNQTRIDELLNPKSEA